MLDKIIKDIEAEIARALKSPNEKEFYVSGLRMAIKIILENK